MNKPYLQQTFALATAACLSASVLAADSGTALKTETDKTSYALGYQIGGDFRDQKMELNEAAVVRGISDARTHAKPLMSVEAMHDTLVDLKRKVVERERAAMPEIAKDKAEGADESSAAPAAHARRPSARPTEGAREFFEKNAQQKSVVSLPSGLQYRVLRPGSGKQPGADDKVALIYRGMLVNGSEFGNTDRDGKPTPQVLSLAALVPGMREAVSHMNEGAKWQVFVPPQLGFDASTPLYRKITVFDVELVAVNP